MFYKPMPNLPLIGNRKLGVLFMGQIVLDETNFVLQKTYKFLCIQPLDFVKQYLDIINRIWGTNLPVSSYVYSCVRAHAK